MKNVGGKRAVVFVASVLTMAACGGTTVSSKGERPDAGATTVVLVNGSTRPDFSQATHVTSTAVYLHEDGTRTVKSRMITVEQAATETAQLNAAIENPTSGRFQTEGSASQDVYCVDNYSLKLYTGQGGAGAKICFYVSGAGTPPSSPLASADLSDYVFGVVIGGNTYYFTWNNDNVQSYRPGSNVYGASSGCLSEASTYNFNNQQLNFSVGGSLTNNTTVYTNYVYLGQVCCPSSSQVTCLSLDFNLQCTSLSTDHNNCGTCGHVCAGGQTCSGGTCVCPGAGETLCDDGCQDLSTSLTDCGACTTPGNNHNITGTRPGVCNGGENCAQDIAGVAQNCNNVQVECCSGFFCETNTGTGSIEWGCCPALAPYLCDGICQTTGKCPP